MIFTTGQELGLESPTIGMIPNPAYPHDPINEPLEIPGQLPITISATAVLSLRCSCSSAPPARPWDAQEEVSVNKTARPLWFGPVFLPGINGLKYHGIETVNKDVAPSRCSRSEGQFQNRQHRVCCADPEWVL